MISTIFGKLKKNLMLYKLSHHDPDLRHLLGIGKNKMLPFKVDQDNKDLINISVEWIKFCQLQNKDGGIPVKYSILEYFTSPIYPSYPETSGYILSTLINVNNYLNINLIFEINRLKNYLLGTQLSSGAFREGYIKMKNYDKPALFDSGQILMGLVKYSQVFEKDAQVLQAIKKCAYWMSSQISDSGQFNEKYTFKGERAYYSQSAYGLLLAGNLIQDDNVINNVKKNIDRICSFQKQNGWIEKWGFSSDLSVLHTIAYTLRGILEAGIYYNDSSYVECVERSINKLLKFKVSWGDLFLLPAHYGYQWKFHDDEVCPTGLAQMAIVLFKLHEITQNKLYLNAALKMNIYLKQLQLKGYSSKSLNGAISGSWPLNGRYNPYDLINWGVKYFIDALLLEEGMNCKDIY